MPPSSPSAAPKEIPSVKAAPRVSLGLHLGELAIAASSSGRDVVIAANSGYAVSNDGGQTFQTNPLPHPANVDPKGDPTVAVGMSGAFYLGYVAIGTAGCSIAVSKSSDNGRRFDLLGHAALCRLTERCFPDQGHLAVDPANSGVGGEDQLYLAYRQCSGNANPTDPGQSPCSRETASCRGQPSLVCSPDGGKTWGARTSIGSLNEIETAAMLVQNSSDADFPRVAVGADGIGYVVFRNGHQLQLSKYSSCTAGLRKLGPTITIPAAMSTPCPDSQLIDQCHCPVPGLDR